MSNRVRRQAAPRGLTLRETVDWHLARAVRDEHGCLIWQGKTDAQGYPQVSFQRYRPIFPRLVLLAYQGEPPQEGMVTSHTCHRGCFGCIEPSHLIWESRSANNARPRQPRTGRRYRHRNRSQENGASTREEPTWERGSASKRQSAT